MQKIESVPLICCFTGHRTIPDAHMNRLCTLLDETLLSLYEEGVRIFRAGGAVGFDTVAALRVLRIKETTCPDIRLELFLPCRDQTKYWSKEEILDYQFILKRADRVQYSADLYTKSCMLIRDRALVDGSDYCVAYLTSNRGGTAYTVAYALKNRLHLINLGDRLPRGGGSGI